MAQVYEIAQLRRKLRDIITRAQALKQKLRSLDRTKETMFGQRVKTSAINAIMVPVLDECDLLAAQIATDLEAIPMTVWAEEYRLGNPPDFRNWDLGVGSDPGTITAEQEGGTITFTAYIATPADGEVYELVDAEDPENSGRVFTLSGGPHSTSVMSSTVTPVGMVDNASDARMRLILRER